MAQDRFFSRWARRKREVRLEEIKPETKPEAAPEASVELPATVEAEGLEAAPPEAQVLVELPSLDSLTAQTDLSEFLKAGVPQMLRNAALRRMWSLDPSIRDYLSEAREYAYDWHISGAVPGTGPMLPTDDIAGMVRDVFAGSKPTIAEPALAEPAADLDAEPRDEVAARDVSAEPEETLVTQGEAVIPPPDQPMLVVGPPARPETVGAEPKSTPSVRLRRHGSALPI
ncbi:MAG: DUF3306 domain-containing protein [Methylobacterium sp.]|uniref:DUF3306 domain-containing protein n=1 Tax=Methylobacterium sp. TaxID=409 RepID=UPI0025E2A50F|nr:DUF3306 domain-containing protein [Methylobacterium sp.]MBX9932702.1 DUF3306 domain-containing protein [Methylobacterium sp.]